MEQKLILLQKPKSELVYATALRSLLRYLLKYKELLMLSTFIISAALLRSAMQFIPSFEPITFFAVLSGFMYGRRKGFIVGASSLYISNFIVFGGQGPWTIFQAFSFGAAGYIAGVFRKNNYFNAFSSMLLSTVLFEIIMNSYSTVFFDGSVVIAFASAIPFTATHLITNTALAFLLPDFERHITGITKLLGRYISRSELDESVF